MAFYEPPNQYKFLEVHCTLIDPENRHLNLKDLIADKCEGYNKFGNWEENGEFLECSAMWMLAFSGQYVNLFADIGFKWRLVDDNQIRQFKKVHQPIYDAQAVEIYRELLRKGTIVSQPSSN